MNIKLQRLNNMNTVITDIVNLIGYECDLLTIMQDLSNYLNDKEDGEEEVISPQNLLGLT